MPARLVIIGGPSKGEMLELAEGRKISIGRGDTADFRISDPTVSRIHCFLQFSQGKAVLKDNRSTSGTRVNGKNISSTLLVGGETIDLGGTRLRFLGESGGAEAENMPQAVVPEDLARLQGSKLGHFQIGPVVAVGHSGVVFQACELKEEREVALKVYLPDFARSEQDLQRFIRAVKTMLPMRHPNLVTLFGGGKTGPYCWMAMEFIEGESLTETIKRIGEKGMLDWRPALNVLRCLANGLFYLHREQIIHRNLSPSNILFNRFGVAKLGSLILAKALSGTLAKDVTLGGEFLGDVRYQAPEQVGAGGSVDARADIYSLGALTYALLTGRPPFTGQTPLETATLILERQPIPPRRVNPHVPQPLEDVVLTMLAKKPADRIQSAGDLLTELEQMENM